MKSKKIISVVTVVMMSMIFNIKASAFSLLPDNIQNIFNLMGTDGSGAAGFVSSKVETALYFTLGILVLFAIGYAIMASFKYIQSQGDPGKIEEAQKAIKAILMGIAMMLLGIVGVVLIFVFFGAKRPDATLTQVCVSAPGSMGCAYCKKGWSDSKAASNGTNWCSECENQYASIANTASTSTVTVTLAPECKDPLNHGAIVPSNIPDPSY